MTMPYRYLLRGALEAAPFLVVVVPFAMLFGVLAAEAGLNITQIMGFSVLIVAGAAQFTALQLMLENASVFLVLAAALVVNLRMAMYAAALAPHLGKAPFWTRALIGYLNFDNSFAMGLNKFEAEPALPVPAKVAYFLGVSIPTGIAWTAATYLGVAVGETIPDSYALDFALPISFLALVAPGLKSLAHVAAAMTSILLALSLFWLPAGLGLILAAFGAMAVGAEIERRSAR